jgi:phosphoethanolamine N-methyltransferase
MNDSASNEETRNRMKSFWIDHSGSASMEEMLLDSNAHAISDNELPEILSILPSFKNKTILELGAGIGYVILYV